MSAAGRCVRSEEMVGLAGRRRPGIDAPEVAELRSHVAACAACQQELARLNVALAALYHDRDPVLDPADWRRIERAVLAEVHAGPEEAAAVVPVSDRSRTLLLSGLLAALLVALVVLGWAALGQPVRALQPAATLSLLPIALMLALPCPPSWQWGLLGSALLLACAAALSLTSGQMVPVLHGTPCLVLALSGDVLPAAVLWRAAGDGRNSLLGGALLGAAIGVCGMAVQRALCVFGGVMHILAVHLLPLLFLMALLARLGQRAAARAPHSRAAS